MSFFWKYFEFYKPFVTFIFSSLDRRFYCQSVLDYFPKKCQSVLDYIRLFAKKLQKGMLRQVFFGMEYFLHFRVG